MLNFFPKEVCPLIHLRSSKLLAFLTILLTSSLQLSLSTSVASPIVRIQYTCAQMKFLRPNNVRRKVKTDIRHFFSHTKRRMNNKSVGRGRGEKNRCRKRGVLFSGTSPQRRCCPNLRGERDCGGEKECIFFACVGPDSPHAAQKRATIARTLGPQILPLHPSSSSPPPPPMQRERCVVRGGRLRYDENIFCSLNFGMLNIHRMKGYVHTKIFFYSCRT